MKKPKLVCTRSYCLVLDAKRKPSHLKDGYCPRCGTVYPDRK